ncbi:LivM ABC-type branched-chain amino acid transport system, permease component [Candidatus Nanopelagicaceae bacterium]
MVKAQKARLNLRDRFGDWWDDSKMWQRALFRVVVIAFFYALPFLDNPVFGTPQTDFASVLFYPLSIFALLAVGLNIVVGKSGILDLGYVAFFAIGAYAQALMGTRLHTNFFINMIVGMLVAMLAGVALGLPALRLRGDYLAIITLGFGEIIRIVANNVDAIGGPGGIPGIPGPPSMFGLKFGVTDPRPFYWLTITVLLIIIWGFLRIAHRRPGRAWEAIREDEDVAEFMGVATTRYKLWAFVLGGAIGGAGGAIYASQITSILPENFKLNLSIMILATVVFGGMGNIWGVILGAVILGYLPEKLRFLSDTRILFFGLMMIIMMNIRPEGLAPRKKREKFDAKVLGE